MSNRDSIRAAYGVSISARLSMPSPVAMSLQAEYGAKGDTGTVHVEVVATDVPTFGGLHLRLALIESNIVFAEQLYNQVLRDYLPDEVGIPCTITQGDTFTHSEDFVIDPMWLVENCDIVAFVQDDTTREVVQTVQGPVIPPPEDVQDLTVYLAQDDIRLEWLPVTTDLNGDSITVDLYRIYRDTVGFFGPGSDPFSSTAETFYLDDSGVVGDLSRHYYYSVTAVAGSKESGFSGAVGEFDIQLGPGK